MSFKYLSHITYLIFFKHVVTLLGPQRGVCVGCGLEDVGSDVGVPVPSKQICLFPCKPHPPNSYVPCSPILSLTLFTSKFTFVSLSPKINALSNVSLLTGSRLRYRAQQHSVMAYPLSLIVQAANALEGSIYAGYARA